MNIEESKKYVAGGEWAYFIHDTNRKSQRLIIGEYMKGKKEKDNLNNNLSVGVGIGILFGLLFNHHPLGLLVGITLVILLSKIKTKNR